MSVRFPGLRTITISVPERRIRNLNQFLKRKCVLILRRRHSSSSRRREPVLEHTDDDEDDLDGDLDATPRGVRADSPFFRHHVQFSPSTKQQGSPYTSRRKSVLSLTLTPTLESNPTLSFSGLDLRACAPRSCTT